MAYAHTTLAQAITELGSRLYNGSNFWPSDELEDYIVESLRTWGALTGFWRDEMSFNCVANQIWYDIPTRVGSLRPHTVTDLDMLSIIEQHLLEPVTSTYPLVWAGSGQFDLATIFSAMERRINETLSLTRCELTRSTIDAPISSATVVLPDTAMELVRVAWTPDNPGVYYHTVMAQSDRYAERAFDLNYLLSSTNPPKTWMQSSELPLSFSVDRIPPVAGDYELITIESIGTLSLSASTTLSIPDDWCWVAKWGAMMDLLLRDSNSQDSVRAQYCQMRYKEGLAFLSAAPAILAARISSTPIAIDAVASADKFNPFWQAVSTGTPRKGYTAGANLLAFTPKPSSATGVTLTVVRNAPIPATTSAYLQVSRDDMDVILDYAQHLAMFKLGGAEFTASIPLYQNFYKRASLYNSKLRAMGQYQSRMANLSQLESTFNPTHDSQTAEVLNA